MFVKCLQFQCMVRNSQVTKEFIEQIKDLDYQRFIG